MDATLSLPVSTQLATALLLVAGLSGASGQYHYNSFTGPVRGAVQEVIVPRISAHFDHHNPLGAATVHDPELPFGASVDYVARPEYSFAYGVDDPVSGNAQSHREERDGGLVRGEYKVLEADGSVRTVTYTVDPKFGFQANVHHTEPDPAAAYIQKAHSESLLPAGAASAGDSQPYDDADPAFISTYQTYEP